MNQTPYCFCPAARMQPMVEKLQVATRSKVVLTSDGKSYALPSGERLNEPASISRTDLRHLVGELRYTVAFIQEIDGKRYVVFGHRVRDHIQALGPMFDARSLEILSIRDATSRAGTSRIISGAGSTIHPVIELPPVATS